MTYVPTPTPIMVSRAQASLEAQDLAREIEDLIIDYRRDHPRVRDGDVDAAIRIAATRAGTSLSRAPLPLITGAVAVLVSVILLLALMMFRTAG